MKKYFYITNLLLFAVIIASFTSCINREAVQGNGTIIKKEIQVGDFKKIEVEGMLNVFINQGPVAKIEIETDENLLTYIDAKVRSKKLKIKEKRNISSTKGVNIYLTVNKIEQINVSAYSSISSTDRLNFDNLTLEASGNSKIKMELNAVKLKAEFSGSSTIELYGNIVAADVAASGSTDINAVNLNFDELKLEASGSSLAKVNVITKFDAKVSGSARVEYLGTPDMKAALSGTGTVTKIY